MRAATRRTDDPATAAPPGGVDAVWLALAAVVWALLAVAHHGSVWANVWGLAACAALVRCATLRSSCGRRPKRRAS